MKPLNKLTAVAAVGLATLHAGSVMASTEAQKQAAIDAGLAWLAASQGANGSWCQSGYCAADTAAALLAFTEQSYKPLGWNGPNYSMNVSKALDFLFLDAGTMPIPNDRGDGYNANISGSGNGYLWGGGESTYVSGLVLPALVRATAGVNGLTPSSVISSSNAAVDGKTYAQVIQDTVDMFANGQSNVNSAAAAGNPGFRGGWRYTPSTGQSDGSTAQWPAIGLLFAEQVPGVTVPQFVKDELTYWIDYIQCSSNGGSGYTVPCGGDGIPVNESKTGGLLVEMAFTGYSGSISGVGDLSNQAGALTFLNANWTNGASGWDGNMGQPYAMWSVYKGLDSTIGLTGSQINNFYYTGAAQIKDDPNDPWNWWEDYSQYLVNTQSGDGSWPGDFVWPQDLATAWNVNILNATQIGPGPDPNPTPEPATLSLLGLALAGLAASVRRKRI